MKLREDLITLLNQMLDEKLIYKRKHPIYDLWVYKYSQRCQNNCIWNEMTLMARGLVLDADYNIIAWPMHKFFNHDEMPQEQIMNIMTPPYQVTDKVDGSLGILVHYNNEYFIATQGSFDSEQAIWATKLLNTKYIDKVKTLDTDNFTYMFEIVYPENKIVVDYGNLADLIYITKVNRHTGFEPMLPDDVETEMLPFKCTPRFRELENRDCLQLKNLNITNREGFVVKSANGRMKIKFDKYLELHRIVNHMSPTAVWKILKKNTQDETRESLPEEILPWWDMQVESFTRKVDEHYNRLLSILDNMHATLGADYTDKDFAELNLRINTQTDAGLLFALEKKSDDVKHVILRLLRPIPDNPYNLPGNNGSELRGFYKN